jgi:hypothetical protein
MSAFAQIGHSWLRRASSQSETKHTHEKANTETYRA